MACALLLWCRADVGWLLRARNGARQPLRNCRTACALRGPRLAVVLPPSGRCACARGLYGSAYATRHIHLSSFSRPAGPGAIRAGCHALRDRVGLRERICAAVERTRAVLIDFHRCDVETSDLAGRRTHYPCCTLLLQLLALAPRAGSDR